MVGHREKTGPSGGVFYSNPSDDFEHSCCDQSALDGETDRRIATRVGSGYTLWDEGGYTS